MQHRLRRAGMDALGQGRSPGQMGCVFGAVGRMHLEADDLAAVEVEDQIQVEPLPLHERRQERHVPAPDFARASGDVCAGWTAGARRPGSATAVHLAVFAQDPMEAGFTRDVDALVGQRRHDPRGRHFGEAGFVRHSHDRCAFRLGQRMRGPGVGDVRPAVVARRAVRGSPPLDGAGIDARQGAGWFQTGTRSLGFMDRLKQGQAIFQAGHASPPSWKIAESFFDSTSKAAVSAKALSLRCRSRSSSLIRRRSRFAVGPPSGSAGLPNPLRASCFQVSRSVGYRPFSRHSVRPRPCWR